MLSLLNKLNCFLVENQNPKYDIIALTEVKQRNRCSEIDLVEVNLPGYNMVLSNITGPDGRGIIVYINESINYTEVIFNTDLNESVWITVKCHCKELLFGCIYRSQSSTVSNNNNGYFLVLFLQRAHSPLFFLKLCEHRIRKKQQIKSTALDAKSYLK